MLTEQLRNQGPAPIQKYGIIMEWEFEKLAGIVGNSSITSWHSYDKSSRKWRAGARTSEKAIALGSFKKKEDAKKAADVGSEFLKSGGKIKDVRGHVDKEMGNV